MFKLVKLLLLAITLYPHYSTPDDSRFLVYTNGAVFKFVLGWGIPVHVPMSVIFAHNIQFQYNPIDNYTEVSALIQNGVFRTIDFTKLQVYNLIENILLRGNHGRECLLKIICELARTPILNSGLFGEILQLLFTPDETASEYGKAWSLGQTKGNCQNIICPMGSHIIESITRIHYI